MFDDVAQQLITWAKAQGSAEVMFSEQTPQAEEPAVNLTLLGLLPFPPPRGLTRAPVRFRMRYLVTCSASTVQAAQVLLGRLLVSALRERDFEVELGEIPPELWMALGWRPQPAFYLLMPVTVPLEEPLASPAREHVVHVKSSQRVWRRGTVTDAEGQPVAGARVLLDGVGQPLYTDPAGHFDVAARPEDTLHVAALIGGQIQHLDTQPFGTQEDWPVRLAPQK